MDTAVQKNHFSFALPLLHRLAAFWTWWIAELGGMLPKGVRGALLPDVEQLFLQLHDNEIVACRGTRENHQVVDRYPFTEEGLQPAQVKAMTKLAGRTRIIVLCLPADKLLAKTLTLPLAAKENLREVLGFEIDRQTPFSSEQVYYDYLLSPGQSTPNTLTLDLLVTPRRYLDEQLELIRNTGLQVNQVTRCAEDSGQPLPVNLLPAKDRQRRPGASRYFNLALGVLALALLLGTIALPLLNKLHVIRALEARVELATGKAEVIRRLREEVEHLDAGSRFLVEKKQTTPQTLGIINELTQILPDDTWIHRLDIKTQELQIQGESATAAALIPLIENSEILRNPRFRSPVTKAPRSETERFHLSAELAGGSDT